MSNTATAATATRVLLNYRKAATSASDLPTDTTVLRIGKQGRVQECAYVRLPATAVIQQLLQAKTQLRNVVDIDVIPLDFATIILRVHGYATHRRTYHEFDDLHDYDRHANDDQQRYGLLSWDAANIPAGAD